MATPSAPVIVRARSATSCKTSSRTNCSSSQTSWADVLSLRDLRFLICSWSEENARSACSASCPGAYVTGEAAVSRAAEMPGSADSGLGPTAAFCGLALMRTVEISVDYASPALNCHGGTSCQFTSCVLHMQP